MNDVGFHEKLDQRPDDWDLRLIYADWLEQQERPEEAFTQRWMAKYKKAPWFHGESHPTPYGWVQGTDTMKPFVLSLAIHVLLPGPYQHWPHYSKWYESLVQAESALQVALTAMRKLLEI